MKGRVLIIEDEQSVADALRLILEDEGCEVTTACCGRGGLAQHANRDFDLAVTDVNLPDVSGLEVLRQLREHARPCPVVVITAHHTPELVEAAKRLGALEVLAKPFFPSDIVGLAARALARARGPEESDAPAP